MLLLVLAVPVRLHSLDRSLWLDETWVANSVLEPDLGSVFYYATWLQTTPPLFLLLERLALAILPLANESFRLLPFLFGLLGVGAMACLALRLLRPPAAFIVLLLFVFVQGHVIYSQTLKQYTSVAPAPTGCPGSLAAVGRGAPVQAFLLQHRRPLGRALAAGADRRLGARSARRTPPPLRPWRQGPAS